MTGCFVGVVGPSGAGKDTLIALVREALAGDPRFVFPRRIVTRAASAWEDHDTIAPADFDRAVGDGGFSLAWRAHGLGYGLPAALAGDVACGAVVVANISRTVVAQAGTAFPRCRIVLVTAPPEVLAARVAGRGRERGADLRQRLDRRVASDADADLVIENVGRPGDAAGRLAAFLRGLTG